ncbi:MAG: PQQ-dependent sugar dehydrogenase [Gammaproteobacteria bacterium]|nr:PQQ-dependent sugar dehydrogenase [Gammaproteobacteria bacterium]
MNRLAACVVCYWALLVSPVAAFAGHPSACKETGTRIPDIRLTEVARNLDSPVHITHAGDGSKRLFIVEQAGRILALSGNKPGATAFLDIRDKVSSGGERGLLSVAFHPRFRSNGRFYVNYTVRDKGLYTIVSEFHLNKTGTVDYTSERVLLRIKQPYSNHNGGQLAFGHDGYLYIGMGDGGSANDPPGNGQNLGTLLGAMLRIDVDKQDKNTAYAIPTDNPFVGKTGARPEIWAYGLRNPWRFSFDRHSGELYAADVGQDEVEEINIIEKGKNYGWRIMEGPQCTPDINPDCNKKGLSLPIYSYRHNVGRSITGGHVYRGKNIPSLCGSYVYGDFVSQGIWALRYKDGKVIVHKTLFDPQSLLKLVIDFFDDDGLLISSFGEDEDGELYVASYQSGRVFRIVAR